MKVWDGFVRTAHWALVASVLTAWVTSEAKFRSADTLHEWAGYAVLAIVALRLAWGVLGGRYARFSQFIAGPRRTLAYAKAILHGAEPRYLGHNPLGGWMIVALLTMAVLAAGSGWLLTTDRFWGIKWMEEVHEALANGFLVLIGVHVAGALFTSLRHGENLVRSMVTGSKRPPAGSDVA